MSFCCYTSPPTFGIANFLLSLFNCRFSIGCVMVFPFNLQFPKDIWYWVSLNMLIWHLYIFFGGVSAQIFCSYCKCFFFFSLLSLRVLLYVLDTSPLSDIYVLQMFSPSLRLVLHSLNRVFCRAEIFNNSEIQHYNFFFMDHALGCI